MSLNSREIPEDKHWYALYTKPRSEFRAAAQLKEINVSYYLPQIETVKQWSDRRKKIIEPVIRGYVFVFVNEKERLEALKQSSVIRCVCETGKPAKIPGWQIENLKIMLESSSQFSVKTGILPGTAVEILDGPFKGVIGKVVQSGNERMISVCIDLLNRSVVTHLPKESSLKLLVKITG